MLPNVAPSITEHDSLAPALTRDASSAEVIAIATGSDDTVKQPRHGNALGGNRENAAVIDLTTSQKEQPVGFVHVLDSDVTLPTLDRTHSRTNGNGPSQCSIAHIIN
jgi:hypothetical protein